MLDSGLCGFIQKPLGAKEYLAAVRNALQTAAYGIRDVAAVATASGGVFSANAVV